MECYRCYQEIWPSKKGEGEKATGNSKGELRIFPNLCLHQTQVPRNGRHLIHRQFIKGKHERLMVKNFEKSLEDELQTEEGNQRQK